METLKIIGNGLWRALLIAVLAGCSSSGTKPDRSTADLAKLPATTPRGEPPSRYGNPQSYEVFGKRYYVDPTSQDYRARGIASWYGDDFHGKRTSSGTPYDMHAMTAAHKSLPIPTHVRVTHLENGRSVVVKVNDRGPFVGDRIIDLSYAAATQLGMVDRGTAEVEVIALPPYQYLPGFAADPSERVASASPTIEPSQAFVQASHQAPSTNNDAIYRPVFSQPSVPADNATASLYLQVGAFSDRRNAERLRSRLASQLNHDIRIEVDQDGLHKVRVGPLSNSAEAEQLAQKLSALGIVHTRMFAN